MKKKITDLGTVLCHGSFSSLGRCCISTCSCCSSTDEIKEDEGSKQKVGILTVYPTPHQSTYPLHNLKEATEEDGMVPLKEMMKMTAEKTKESRKKQQQNKEIIQTKATAMARARPSPSCS
eukprot:9131180-Ditylum_brightwellii.AAC.1